jgi:MoCo/4Fe-4S cofactor protein with predicted Tat translocation signal
MSSKNQYWKGLEELNADTAFLESKKNEFSEGLPMTEALDGEFSFNTNRRDFLKFFGFSVAAVSLAACNKAPVKYAIPYVVKPENVTPGVPLFYASNLGMYNEGFPILVKVREGRPIKFEGNDQSSISGGGLCGTGQASILSLYDTTRHKNPTIDGKEVEDWSKVDVAVISKLDAIAAVGGAIRVVTRTNTSLVMKSAIASLIEKYPTAQTVVYDPISYSGILNANEKSFGKRVVPNYVFSKANVIVSFGADFLGSWISPVRFSKEYSKNRVPANGTMSRHIQFESLMSLSGANADARIPMRESKEGVYVATLYNKIAALAKVAALPVAANEELAGDAIAHAAKDLWNAKGNSLVISKSNDVNIQLLVNGINSLLQNYGSTIDLDNHSNISSYDESKFEAFVNEIGSGSIKGVVFVNCNPVYSYHNNDKLAAGLKKASLVVSTSNAPDETSAVAKIVAPDNHFLESWDILEPQRGQFVFSQPTISNVFNTRQAFESVLAWSGKKLMATGDQTGAYTYVKGVCTASLTANWDKAIHDGLFSTGELAATIPAMIVLLGEAASAATSSKAPEMDLILYQKSGPRDGSWSNNPWVHEMPDAVSKVCYDNYLTIGKSDADKMKLEQGDLVTVTVGGKKIENLPVLVQPGQSRGTVGIAVGYGRKVADTVTNDLKNLGKNAFVFASVSNGTTSYLQSGVKIDKTGSGYVLAQTQSHQSMEGRDIVKEATIGEYNDDPYVTNRKSHELISLWEDYDYSNGHHWGMAIDLNACTGCGACVVSCSIENNVPVVGRQEIRNRREMHWIRIDRYYSFDTANGYISKEKEIDKLQDEKDGGAHAFENVKVVHMPVMCQHCDNAPCETVCPVLATTHSSEGLNQMTYNRCIGTKYCGNNCPYKVRRFNWFRYNDNDNFDYHFNNDLGKMVINPDVTVRTRGVMEKCSFCIQSIQSAKLTAKRENRKLADGDVKTACARTCPSNAIVFGDINDSNSEISKLYKNERSYHLLEEVNTRPSVVYLTKIRNVETNKTNQKHS